MMHEVCKSVPNWQCHNRDESRNPLFPQLPDSTEKFALREEEKAAQQKRSITVANMRFSVHHSQFRGVHFQSEEA